MEYVFPGEHCPDLHNGNCRRHPWTTSCNKIYCANSLCVPLTYFGFVYKHVTRILWYTRDSIPHRFSTYRLYNSVYRQRHQSNRRHRRTRRKSCNSCFGRFPVHFRFTRYLDILYTYRRANWCSRCLSLFQPFRKCSQ